LHKETTGAFDEKNRITFVVWKHVFRATTVYSIMMAPAD